MKKIRSHENLGAVQTITSKEGRKKMEKGKRKDGITLIALVVTIVLNCSYLAMVEANPI